MRRTPLGQWMRRWSDGWSRFWYEPHGPEDLGLCRVLFYGALFVWYARVDFALWAAVSDVFWMPIQTFRILHLSIASDGALRLMSTAWKVALALSSLGFATRASTATSAVLGFYLLGLPHNFGKTHHFDALIVIVLAIMAASRCGDAYSLDRLLRIGRPPAGAAPEIRTASGEYTWPIRAVWVTFALIFFAAGVAKARHPGLAWVASDNMAVLLVKHQYHVANADPLTSWGLYLAQFGWLCRLFAGTSVAVELSYPLALVSRRARWVLVPAMLSIQTGIRVLMGPSFDLFMLCNLFWVPWGRLWSRVGARRERPSLRASHPAPAR